LLLAFCAGLWEKGPEHWLTLRYLHDEVWIGSPDFPSRSGLHHDRTAGERCSSWCRGWGSGGRACRSGRRRRSRRDLRSNRQAQCKPSHALGKRSVVTGCSERLKPRSIRRRADQATVVVRCTVRPPQRPALSKRDLCGMHVSSCLREIARSTKRILHRTSCLHQLPDQVLSLLIRELWIRPAPEATTHDKVPPIRRHGV
jgi:hypothetical protein